VRTSSKIRIACGVLAVSAVLCGADQKIAAADKKGPVADKKPAKNAPAAANPKDLAWPLPPDPPRVRWVSEYTDMAKIRSQAVKKSSWLDKVTGTKTTDEKFEFRKPYGIATDKHGKIYVADTELKFVFVIDPVNKTVERREGTTRAPLSLPVGVALDAEDRLFVSDADLHWIVCFSETGKPLASFGAPQLGRPGGIALDKDRNRLYVADAKAARIAVFDSGTFQFLNYIGGPGKPPTRENGKFFGPTNVALDKEGNIYVADTLNYRIQVFDPSGKFIRGFGAQGDRPGEFIRPKGIAVDSEGHVYVADAEFNNFQILTANGQPLLAVGTLGTDPGQFALIAGLYIDPKDQIYTSEMFKGRLQVFQYISQPASGERKEVNRAANH
jgi:DNA-binding beta-propeller fold protein YncE